MWTGEPTPLGAFYDGSGTNFAVFSSSAEHVELCLLDGPGEQAHEEHRIELNEVDGHIWHGYLPDVIPGQHYGYRVHGEWNPAAGLWHNPNKLLLDPYAKRIDGPLNWNPACFGYDLDDPDALDPTNSAPYVPIGAVHDQSFDWADDELLRTPTHESVIYETHIRGLTMQHPAVAPQERGTFAAIRNAAVLEHLVGLGVTAIE